VFTISSTVAQKFLINNDKVVFGLRTTAWIDQAGDIMHDANNRIRKLAIEEKLVLFDLDYMIWSIVYFDYNSRHMNYLFQKD
jgi:hypothetical protein